MKTFKQFYEDAVAANAASGGGVAGIGVGPQGEPGVKKKKKSPVLATLQRRMPNAAPPSKTRK